MSLLATKSELLLLFPEHRAFIEWAVGRDGLRSGLHFCWRAFYEPEPKLADSERDKVLDWALANGAATFSEWTGRIIWRKE